MLRLQHAKPPFAARAETIRISRAVLRTERTYVLAAFAGAENPRTCGTPIDAARRKSPKRSLEEAGSGGFQTGLFAAVRSNNENEDKPVTRYLRVNWRFRPEH
jgi:hypothetical protein